MAEKTIAGKPIDFSDITNELSGMAACRLPDVPIRIRFNDVLVSLTSLFLRSIFTNASSSLTTMKKDF
jgi:hypothetical protein